MNKNSTLAKLLKQHQSEQSISSITQQFNTAVNAKNNDQLINVYNQAIPVIEHLMWRDEINDNSLKHYQQLFHELEELISCHNKADTRNKFIIAIPVADRPQHLNDCLQSILELCTHYKYGGKKNGLYEKVCVLISDDSQHQENIDKNKTMAKKFTQNGLQIHYFGAEQQKEIIASLDEKQSENILGSIKKNAFYHKGASITRNITYLKLQQLQNKDEATLFYFIDSDQEFKVSILNAGKHQDCYGLNYFYYLDKIFSNTDISILTGKVVGDPPVSPSVMAGTFLQDLIYFVNTISKLKPDAHCTFHTEIKQQKDDASYHDMAELFGFKNKTEAYNYHCPLQQEHDHLACFTHFSSTLKHFFDGEHATRKSYYQHLDVMHNLSAARTIYTGNYIFKPQNLKYFIPFANLKLRMAGPVLGRIIKSELGDRFVSANLPMLHKRTISSIGKSEYRPGVKHKQTLIDLSDEFSRQFFGDVMLFTMLDITAAGYPEKQISHKIISDTTYKVIYSLRDKYTKKHQQVSALNNSLKEIINNPDNWWKQNPDSAPLKQDIMNFINNIEFNFGKDAAIYKKINSADVINSYHKKIVDAIYAYPEDREYWQDIISKGVTSA